MPPVTETTTEARPLTADERKVLADLIKRDSAFAAPATRMGEPYEALVNLSVPRRDNTKDDRQCDLVYRGETVYLTREEAEQFSRHGARDGRLIPVVRKLAGPDGSREPLPRVLPRHVSGRLFRPAVPPPGSDAPRPDPEGSSQVIEYAQEGRAPEGAGAMSPEPSEMADNLSTGPAAPDAVDLPPARQRQRTHGGR